MAPVEVRTLISIPKFPMTQDILTGGMVSIAVGPEEVPFDAHIELLCAHSPRFDKELKDRFKVAGTKYLSLPDYEPEIFTKVLSWMYSPCFGVSQFNESMAWKELFCIWIFANRYQIYDLQNHMIDTMARKYKTWGKGKGNLEPSLISYVYDRTLASSHLRHAIIDICVWGMDVDHFVLHLASFPSEFKDNYACQQALRAHGEIKEILLVSHPSKFYADTKAPKAGVETKKQKGLTEPYPHNNRESVYRKESTYYSEFLWANFEQGELDNEPKLATPTQMAVRTIRTPRGRRSASATPIMASTSPVSPTLITTPPSAMDTLANDMKIP